MNLPSELGFCFHFSSKRRPLSSCRPSLNGKHESLLQRMATYVYCTVPYCTRYCTHQNESGRRPRVRNGTAAQHGDMILVTGATGRTGRHIVKSLLDLGFKVRVMSRLRHRAARCLLQMALLQMWLKSPRAMWQIVLPSLKRLPSAEGAKVSRLILRPAATRQCIVT